VPVATSEPVAWNTDCPSIARPAPLSLEAAREAYRSHARRHDLRLREAAYPGTFLKEVQSELATNAQKPCLSELAETGQQLFEHEYAYEDGLGGGEAAKSARGPFRRVHEGLFGAPETISCPSCHWVGGPNGAGAETDNAFLSGDGLIPESGDARNSPALVALGVVQALAREMTLDLQKQRDEFASSITKKPAASGEAQAAAKPREHRLTSKGVDFGILRANEKSELDLSGLDGIDADLVVKPFGWKGTRPDIATFATEALQVHIGVQGDALVKAGIQEESGRGENRLDPDGDGRLDELSEHALSAMTVHLALLELPIVEPLVQDRDLEPAASGLLPPTQTSFIEDFAKGREHFQNLGCATCHKPMMVLENPVLELQGVPPIDLSKEMRRPALVYDQHLGGYPVWLFSDLKRHNMGRDNVARHEQRGVAKNMYLTPRLWGVADSAPYLHDGRAPSFDYAIGGHDGEGSEARKAYFELPLEEKGFLRVYLMSMRRAPRVIIP
jgi:hypothetical protein